ncbi:hypothetical protein AWB68_08502 [Caballeronia choica]|nr:hypothetical protein AWB68_08502 [Caballeronia choica]
MLGMLVLLHQARYRFTGGGSDTLSPVDQSLRGPLHVGAMRCGHVRGGRGKAAMPAAARMTGYPLPPMQELDHRGRDTRLQRLAHQCMRHAVA